MDRARDILPALYADCEGAERDEELALAYWETAAGEWLSSHTKASSLNRGGLIIEVDSARWQAELDSLSGRLIGRLNGLIGRSVVNRLWFRLAQPPRKPVQRAAAASGEVNDPMRRRVYERSKASPGS